VSSFFKCLAAILAISLKSVEIVVIPPKTISLATLSFLVWQGKGEGTLQSTSNIVKKEARIKEFVSQILEQYPPNTVALK